MKDNITHFKEIAAKMASLYEEKNKNYGNSFDKSLNEDGLLVSKIRLNDKLNRFSSLIKKGSEGTSDESILDTLIDLANYAIMTFMWIEDNLALDIATQDKPSKKGKQAGYVATPSNIINKVGFIK